MRLGQSLARLPANKAAVADAAIAAGALPDSQPRCQISVIDGIGETYEQQLCAPQAWGTFWELTYSNDAELRQILLISDLPDAVPPDFF